MLLLMGEATQPVPRSQHTNQGQGLRREPGTASPVFPAPCCLPFLLPCLWECHLQNRSSLKQFSDTAKDIFVLWVLSTATCTLLCIISFFKSCAVDTTIVCSLERLQRQSQSLNKLLIICPHDILERSVFFSYGYYCTNTHFRDSLEFCRKNTA